MSSSSNSLSRTKAPPIHPGPPKRRDSTLSRKDLKRSESTADELYSGFLLPSKWSRHSDAQDRNVLLPLGPKEMIFLVLEDPSSCGLAKLTSIAMMAVIVLSSLIYVIASHPYLRSRPSTCSEPACDHDPILCPDRVVCEPEAPASFDVIEIACMVLFTLDYGLRIIIVGALEPRIAGVLTVEEERKAMEDATKQAEKELGDELTRRQEKELQHELMMKREKRFGRGGGRHEQKEQEHEPSPVVGPGEVKVSKKDIAKKAQELLKDPYLAPQEVFWRYVTQVMNVIDVVAIVPFYIELGTSSGSSIGIVRVLRLARMLRIFKASKYNEGSTLLSSTIWRSIPALSLLFFFTALGVVLFGSLIFFMEGGDFKVTEDFPSGAYLRNGLLDDLEETPYTSIPVACYWVIVTATTVGFGDLYPTSAGGRLVAVVCMYIGLLVLALPITVVGSNFSRVYEEKQDLEDKKEHQLLLRAGASMDLTDVNGCDEVSIGGPTPRSRESRRQTMVSLRFQLASQQASIRSLQDVHSKQGSQRGNSAYFGDVALSPNPASHFSGSRKRDQFDGANYSGIRPGIAIGNVDSDHEDSQMLQQAITIAEQMNSLVNQLRKHEDIIGRQSTEIQGLEEQVSRQKLELQGKDEQIKGLVSVVGRPSVE